MTIPEPPLEAHRYARSQTPESPRPLHIPEPSNIPVLQNQMDPVFNDTTTYDIRPNSQPSTTISEKLQDFTASAPNQNTRNLFDYVGQHRLATGNEDAVESDQQCGQIVSGNQFTENEAISQNLSDTVSNANPPTTHPPPLQTLQPAAPQTSLPQQDSSHRGESDVLSPIQTSLRPLDDQNDQAQGPVQVPSNGAGDQPVGPPKAPDSDPQSMAQSQDRPSADDGVNYQSLLDNLVESAAIAESHTAPATAEPVEASAITHTESEKPLPPVAGLPPRPPPQEKPAIHPNYSANESIRSYHQLPNANTNASSFSNQLPPYRQDTSMPPVNVAPLPPNTFRAANGLPPPPALGTYQQPQQNVQQHGGSTVQMLHDRDIVSSPKLRVGYEGEDIKWPPEIQEQYDQFLRDERNYVTEGVWDRFPPGSRLFVGNLPTEKVTKRDLFHVFHKHGKLAQISIKQAYGFVQFLEAASCYQALAAEQGEIIRGRKIHLEVSKPQKNTRNSGTADRGTMPRRRSRSPERRGGSRSSTDRFERASYSERLPFSDYRDEPPRRRDEYRPVRSPSPRGYRSREDYRLRERSPAIHGQWDSQAAPGRAGGGPRPPSPKVFDEDAALPLPRRDPRDVPDVQILILEEVASDFVNYIEQGFRSKGLCAQTIRLDPRIALGAVIKRQVIEGVQAVVKLTRNTQFSSRIPLQVFDRGGGASNVNFNEYVDLDVHVAADIVISARQKERMTASVPAPAPAPAQAQAPAPYALSHGYSAPTQQFPYAQPQPVQQAYPPPPSQPYTHQHQQVPPQQYAPQLETAYRSPAPINQSSPSGAPNLQELLANLRQPSQSQPTNPTQPSLQAPSGSPTDLAGLLSNVARQQAQPQGYSQPIPQQSPLGQYPNRPPLHPYPNPAGSSSFGPAPQLPQQNVQNIMEQLARWNK